ncbi:hypothetical protein LTR84_011367 [Exophiala bonariae]|uniref:Major facilitator superfamily (MFS) profile domain-containing protein n=1 Tax=Exophiala bonariae TaxID=1690606 RepID=A0AAV9MSF6_9EURO|nr:hypothetical protein LTR84_011367 [Exophiala bonariae]
MRQSRQGLGAGGGKPSSVTRADISNAVLYGVFVFSSFLASSLINVLGPRFTVCIGVTGYPLYTGAMWYYDVTGRLWYPVFAGAYLGVSAGCLWTTASYMANTYPEERDKGMWRAIQWTGNLLGATVGGCIALGINWNAKSTGVPHSVYIIFVILACCSLIFGAMILPPEKLIRSDGTNIAEFKPISMKASIIETSKMFTDPIMILMLPVAFIPEMFMPLLASMNAYAYNLRTRSLNNVLNNVTQIPTVIGCGLLLDNKRLRRKTRALIAITIIMIWVTGSYIAQTIWLSSWKFNRHIPGPSIDINDAAYPGAVIIYLFYGGQYGMFQNTVVWIIGSLTNDPRRISHMSGIFVGLLSAGTAISFGCDATAQPYENENAAFFALTMLCWPSLFYVVWKYMKDTNYFLEEGVIVPIHARKQLQIHVEETGQTLENENNNPDRKM